MGNSYITIQEASELANKSIQTIRRSLKSKKLKYKRQDTPQGFNYLIQTLVLTDNQARRKIEQMMITETFLLQEQCLIQHGERGFLRL
jgi:hypothetical protein